MRQIFEMIFKTMIKYIYIYTYERYIQSVSTVKECIIQFEKRWS